jgi:hypothetical protein
MNKKPVNFKKNQQYQLPPNKQKTFDLKDPAFNGIFDSYPVPQNDEELNNVLKEKLNDFNNTGVETTGGNA